MAKGGKDKLSSFKISDRRRPEVRGGQARQQEGSEEVEAPSTGFPAIESRLEAGTVEAVAEELRGSYARLEALSQSGSSKERAAAEKAMAAYERTADLFEYLFATKAALAQKG